MKSARAASLPETLVYAPGTTLNLNVTFPMSYDLSGKWQRFVVKKSATGSTLYQLNDGNSVLTVSGDTASVAAAPTTANDISGGLTLGALAKADTTLFYAYEFGDDSDTSVVEYRLQGDLLVVAEAGDFEEISSATSTTVAFEEVTVSVTFGAAGPAGADGGESPFWQEVVLTSSGADIAAGTKVAMLSHQVAGTITGFKLVCDPANEPDAAAVQVDMNAVDLSTGAATTRLSSVAQIATGANASTGGAISGTQTVAAGDQSSFDIDQGSDGKELRALVQITPTTS